MVLRNAGWRYTSQSDRTVGARPAPWCARGVTSQINPPTQAIMAASTMNRPRQSVYCSAMRTGSVADAAPRPPTAIR
jgi:hypothetical protein